MKKQQNSNEAFSNGQFEAKTIAAKNEMDERLAPEFSLKLLSKKAAAEYLNISCKSLNLLITEGRLGFVMPGKTALIPGYELIRFLAENLIRVNKEETQANYNTDEFRLSTRADKHCQSFDTLSLFENMKREGIHG